MADVPRMTRACERWQPGAITCARCGWDIDEHCSHQPYASPIPCPAHGMFCGDPGGPVWPTAPGVRRRPPSETENPT